MNKEDIQKKILKWSEYLYQENIQIEETYMKNIISYIWKIMVVLKKNEQ